jgi:cell division protein ZapD
MGLVGAPPSPGKPSRNPCKPFFFAAFREYLPQITASAPIVISYEYPLSERVRTLLRLEDLYERVDYFSGKIDALEHHAALLSIFEILEVSGRADLKSDLLQELERQKQTLEALRENPDISEEALDNVLWQIDQASSRLFQASGKVGQELRENEWLMSIKQRTSIPGGVCEFDLPSYHYWLQQNPELRRRDLNTWLSPFLSIKDGINIVLRLLRESGKTTPQVACQGVYQQMMAGRMAQMLRIRLSRNYHCVPEMSANKYALNIRFTTQEGGQRPKAVEDDIEFELTFCNL